MKSRLRAATPPRRPWLFLRWLWRLAKDVIAEFRADGVGDMAAAVTFWTLLSIPAAVLALVSLLSSLGAVVGASLAEEVQLEIEAFVADTFADSDPLLDTVRELFDRPSTGVATAATALAIVTLSRAFAGVIRALDVAYEVEEQRPWWLVRLLAVGLGVGTLVVVATGATILAILPTLPFGGVLSVLAVPLVLAGLVGWAATLFHLGPNHETPWRYDLPGAIVTTVAWVVLSQSFALYVRLSGSANDVQTTVGAIVLALGLVHLLGVALLVGAEVNDVIARRAGIVGEVRLARERFAQWNRGILDRSGEHLYDDLT